MKVREYLKKTLLFLLICTLIVQGTDRKVMAEEVTIGSGAKIMYYDSENTHIRHHFGRVIGTTVKIVAAPIDNQKITNVKFTSSDPSVCSVTKIEDHYELNFLSEGIASIILDCKADGETVRQTALASSFTRVNYVQGILKANTTAYEGASDKDGISSRKTEVKAEVPTQENVRIDGVCNGYYRVFLDGKNFGTTDEYWAYVKVDRVTVPVTEIKLPQTLTMYDSKEEKLQAEVLPEIATDKGVTWNSSNTKVVTVDKQGKLKAVGRGEAVITVKSTANKNIVAKCRVTVKPYIPVTGIKLIPDKTEVENGLSGKLKVEITPENASIQEYAWAINNDTAIAIDPKGRYIAKKPGSVTVTVISKDNGLSDSCEMTILPVEAKGVALQKELELDVGETDMPTWQMIPVHATNKDVVWRSDNEKIATVDKYGTVTGVAEGKTTIYVTTKEGEYTASCQVTVSKFVKDLYLKNAYVELKKGKTKKLDLDIIPLDCSKMDIKWYSKNSSIATVTQDGIVTAKKRGSTDVIVYDQYTGAFDFCSIHVVSNLKAPNLVLKYEMGKKKMNVVLHWKTQEKATKYVIYAKTQKTEYKKIAKVSAKTKKYIIKGAKEGNKYKIRAYDAKNKEYSDYSDVVKIK